MASSINASTSGGGGIIVTSDATGNLNIQSGGSTVVAVTSAGAAVTGTLSATGSITGSSTVAGSTGILYPLTSGTAVATTSGTSIDFTSIPSWVKRITVMLSGVSTNGSSNQLIQIGSGSVSTTGYLSSNALPNSGGVTGGGTNTTGFGMGFSNAANIYYGTIIINSFGSNIYVASYNIIVTSIGASAVGGGGITLSGALDRIRLTTVNGTDTFDAGSVNILYE